MAERRARPFWDASRRTFKALAEGARDLWDFARHGLDLDLSDMQFGFEEVEPLGSRRITVVGRYARFHSRAHGDPTRLHTLLLDTTQKLDAAERFAQAGLHCGHFFAAGAAGARSEAEHYRIDLRKRFLLEVDLELGDILDLTNQEALRDAVAEATDPSDSLARRPYTQSLKVLLDQTSGGNPVTDLIGANAVVRGYRGILFFGARAITDQQLRSVLTAGGTSWVIDREASLFADLRAQTNLFNLVIFSAADAVRHIPRFRVDGGEWRDNPLFAATAEDLRLVYERDGLPASVVTDPQEWLEYFPGPRPLLLDYQRVERRGRSA